MPQSVVNLKTVKLFQRKLHASIKCCANKDIPSWEIFLHSGVHLRGVTFFRKIFEDEVVARPVVDNVPLFHPSTETWW